MSAITGIFMRNGKDVDPELMKKMNEKLSHRGPDGSAIWCDGPVGLGHQMLWTTQESLHEKLPFEENGLIITADARIDNRDELSKELGLRDKEDVSDSYFILKAYEMWGEECPDKLLGDFAFAIWDKAQEKLFCARDHMGVKPFYYYLDDDMFVFGTEIKALLKNPNIPIKLNEKKIALYLTDIREKKFTFYENIFNLSGSNSIVITIDQFIIKKFWELDTKYQVVMDSEEDYITAFNKIFFEAINCRLRSAYPIGFELSGGLDSSSIICVAKKIFNNEKKSNFILKSFSIIYKGFPKADESNFIKAIIDKGQIKPYFIVESKNSLLKKIRTILWHVEQPFFTPFMSYIWDFYNTMNENNIRVVLGGTGSDEIFDMGNSYLNELLVSFKWKTLLTEFTSRLKQGLISSQDLKNIFIPLIPEFMKKLFIFHYKKLDLIPFTSILNKVFLNRIGGYAYLKKVYYNYYGEFLKNRVPKNYQYFTINAVTYNRYASIASLITSNFLIEPRYPFLDKRMVEFCYGIPTEMKVKFGWNKYILRVAMDNIIPPEIQWRRSKGATDQVFYNNFISFDKNLLENIIYENKQIIQKWVELDKVTEIYENYKKNKCETNLLQLWFITILFLWLKESEDLEIIK
ncbi:MAG: asparagine synthase (glutamine-hydrolyzing) [Methanobacteriaceae archaeon]|nr:asparagine synthase (glutamine-hydrolyzing) [Methanobacteriaceae archaeon]